MPDEVVVSVVVVVEPDCMPLVSAGAGVVLFTGWLVLAEVGAEGWVVSGVDCA